MNFGTDSGFMMIVPTFCLSYLHMGIGNKLIFNEFLKMSVAVQTGISKAVIKMGVGTIGMLICLKFFFRSSVN